MRDGKRLKGTVFGEPAGKEGAPADYAPAFDGDTATVFKHKEGSGVYFGLDIAGK